MLMMPLLGMGGGTIGTVTLSGRSVTPTATDPADSEAGFRLGTDGKIYRRLTFGGAYNEIVSAEWLDPKDAALADQYEALATVTAGTLTTGTSGSWIALTSDRDWTKTQTSVGTSTVTFTLDIRQAPGGPTLASASITLTPTVDP